MKDRKLQRTNSRRRLALLLAIAAMAGSAAAGETESQAAAPAAASQAAMPAGALYTVVDGNKVDATTLDGWKTWRARARERSHRAAHERQVGPALVEKLQTLKKDEFHDLIMNGRPEKGMPPFNGSAMVTKNWEGLYAYLKGRSDGQIKPGHLYPIEAK